MTLKALLNKIDEEVQSILEDSSFPYLDDMEITLAGNGRYLHEVMEVLRVLDRKAVEELWKKWRALELELQAKKP